MEKTHRLLFDDESEAIERASVHRIGCTLCLKANLKVRTKFWEALFCHSLSPKVNGFRSNKRWRLGCLSYSIRVSIVHEWSFGVQFWSKEWGMFLCQIVNVFPTFTVSNGWPTNTPAQPAKTTKEVSHFLSKILKKDSLSEQNMCTWTTWRQQYDHFHLIETVRIFWQTCKSLPFFRVTNKTRTIVHVASDALAT